MSNNSLLPPSLNVHLARWVDKKICVRNDHCIQLTWQQPFIDGWHNITTAPLSTTWFLWLSLLVALPGIFLVLPRYHDKLQNHAWKITYRLLYNGPLSQLDDPDFPDEQREHWPPESSIVKITITSTQFLRKKDNMGKDLPNLPYRFLKDYTEDEMYGDAQDFLYLNLGLGTTVHSVFLTQKTSQNPQDLSTVSYDPTTGNIVAKVKPIVPTAARVGQYWDIHETPLARQFPIQFYVVVDSFAGSIDAATPTGVVAQLREQRSPKVFITLVTILQNLLLWIYILGFYFALQISSYIFFRKPATNPPELCWFIIGWLIVVLVFTVLEIIFTRIAIRRPNPLPLNPLIT